MRARDPPPWCSMDPAADERKRCWTRHCIKRLLPSIPSAGGSLEAPAPYCATENENASSKHAAEHKTARTLEIRCYASPFRVDMMLLDRDIAAERGRRWELFLAARRPRSAEKILLSAANDSAMRIQFLPPERTKAEGDNGAPVLGYKVEVAKRVNDVQTFTVKANGPVLSGSYKVTFTNAAGTVGTTSCIPWNATEVEFEMALEELANVDRVSVSRSAYGGALNGYVYSIEFNGKYLGFPDTHPRSGRIIQRDGKGALPLCANVGSAPDTPSLLGILPISGSEMEVRFKDPSAHGDPVRKYMFEYAAGDSFGTPPAKLLRIFNVLENDIAGTFQLQYGDQLSPLLPIHTTSQGLSDALNSLSSLRPVSTSHATCILTGETPSRVKSLSATQNVLTTTQLAFLQAQLLVVGAVLRADTNTFIVKTQPKQGDSAIKVQPGHGVASFTQDLSLVKIDASGSGWGPHGCEWTISFVSEMDQVSHQTYPGLQLVSSLVSVERGTQITNLGISDKNPAIPPTYHGAFGISNDEDTCDTYAIGTFKLQLGQETTSCITLGKTGAKSTLKAALEALGFVSKVAVEEQRVFKVSVLTGSSASKVTAYDSTQNLLTVTSSGPGLTASEANTLSLNALIQVSRNPNDFSRHSCEFKVTTAAAAHDTTIAASAVGGCSSFSGESRSLKVLDFHDYKIRFWGQYPTGEWPTLKIVQNAFGAGACAPWAPAAIPVYSTIHTIKYEGVCAGGSGGTQTIVADAATEIGYWFSLSYLGKETPALSFKTTTASVINDDALQDDIRGSFRLAFGGETTESIGYAATHMKVTQELQKLDKVNSVIALGDADAGDVFFIDGQKLTVAAINAVNGLITTMEQFGGNSIAAATPEIYVFDNRLRTTDNLRSSCDPNRATAADVGNAATYKLSFGDEVTDIIQWAGTGTTIKGALETLDGIDDVTVNSAVYGNGFVHSITFWGMYPTTTLPVLGSELVGAVAPANVAIRVRSNNVASHNIQQTTILQPSQDYMFRIFAMNPKGISNSASGYSTKLLSTSIIPTPPTSVSLGEYHGPTWLPVNYHVPFYTGDAEVTMYRLEWDSSPTFDSSSADYGVANIRKLFEAQQATTIYRSATGMAAQMTDALAIITDTVNVAVGPVKVTRTRASWGYSWKITFLHNPGDLALLVADSSLMTGDFPRVTVTEVVKGFSDLAIDDFAYEVQVVYTDAYTLLSGTFKLEFEGRISRSVSVDASSLEMQEALQETTTIYSIKVSKVCRSQALDTAIWSVTFAHLRGEELVGAGNVFTIAVADASLLVGTSASVRVASKIVGSDPFAYTITGLRTGVRYYFHAMAYNAEGFGSATSPMSTAVTCGHPNPPKSVVASVVNGTILSVTWGNNENNGSCPADKYKIERYRAEGTREEQTITTSAGKGLPETQNIQSFADSDSIGGYFKLSFKGESTANIIWNAPAIGLNSAKERLERLATVGTVDVTRRQSIRVVAGLIMTALGNTLTRDASSAIAIADAGFTVGDQI
ncbi:hypothetical protein FI667_g4132, partial [Globisporangium splendens]